MNTVAIIGRMLLALVLVLGLMWGLARFARKPLGGKADRVMAVLARQQINRNASVTVLRVMDRALVLGVTEQGIRLITETDLSAVEDALAAEPETSRGFLRSRPVLPSPEQALELADLSADADVDVDAIESATPARPARAHAAATPRKGGSLDGSVLSPGTWRQVVGAARDLTVRR